MAEAAPPRRGVTVAGASAGKRFSPLVTELAEAGIPVTVACRVLKLSRQPCCQQLANPITPREVREASRANVLFDAYKDDPELGHRLPQMRRETASTTLDAAGHLMEGTKKSARAAIAEAFTAHADFVRISSP